MRSRRKSAAQLDREIAAALAKKPRAQARRHHATMAETPDDQWLVVMDALMSGDAKLAADVWNQLYAEHGATIPPERFTKALQTKSKTKIDKTVLQQFKRLAPRFEASLKRNARLAARSSWYGRFLRSARVSIAQLSHRDRPRSPSTEPWKHVARSGGRCGVA